MVSPVLQDGEPRRRHLSCHSIITSKTFRRIGKSGILPSVRRVRYQSRYSIRGTMRFCSARLRLCDWMCRCLIRSIICAGEGRVRSLSSSAHARSHLSYCDEPRRAVRVELRHSLSYCAAHYLVYQNEGVCGASAKQTVTLREAQDLMSSDIDLRRVFVPVCRGTYMSLDQVLSTDNSRE